MPLPLFDNAGDEVELVGVVRRRLERELALLFEIEERARCLDTPALHERQLHKSDVRRHVIVGLEADAHLIEVLPRKPRSLKLVLADGKLDEADLAVRVPLIDDVVGGENAPQLAEADARS